MQLTKLQDAVKRILGVKYDLGLFHNPYLDENIDSHALVESHLSLAREAAQKSIVLLENRNETLPLRPAQQNINKIAMIGPFADTFNYGSYSGVWGSNPAENASTIRQGIIENLARSSNPKVEVLTAWGANSWNYNAQHNIPSYLLSFNSKPGGLQAIYYHDLDFQEEASKTIEIPNRDWGLFPPLGLSSNTFSAVWQGDLEVPVSSEVNGIIGIAVSANTTTRLYLDGKIVAESPESTTGNFLREIMPYAYTVENGTSPPPGGFEFLFKPGAKHRIRIEYQTRVFQANPKPMGVHSKIQLWWNLTDRKDAVAQVSINS